MRGPDGEVRLPPFTRQTLPNGVTLDLMPRPGVPLVGFRILVNGGAESEPSNLSGLAGITAQLLRKGTAKRTADQFSEELDFLGGSFQTPEATQSPASVIAEFLKKDFDRGLDLVSDAVLHASFPEPEVRKFLAQRIDSAKSIKDNPQAAIGLYFASFFFGPGHPYGRVPDESTLSRIQRQDIVDFHTRNYCGKNLVVIVSGDFDPHDVTPKIASAFGGVSPGEAFRPAKDPSIPASGRLLLIDKPDATQTYFYIGEPGIDRTSPRSRQAHARQSHFRRPIHIPAERGAARESRSHLRRYVHRPTTAHAGATVIASFTKTETRQKKRSTWRWRFSSASAIKASRPINSPPRRPISKAPSRPSAWKPAIKSPPC